MIDSQIQKGRILIAEPAITGDISFSRAVVLIAEHTPEGSVGFILNKPLSHTLNELIAEIHIPFPIYNGGPVEQDNLYFIHSIPQYIKGSIEIGEGLFWGGHFKTLVNAINDGRVNKENIKFFLGYSGWASKQLYNEVHSKSWITSVVKDLKGIVKKNPLELWKEKLKELGGEYLIWSNTPENPNLN